MWPKKISVVMISSEVFILEVVSSPTHYCGIFVKTDNVDYTYSWEEHHTRVNENNKWATTAAKEYQRVAGELGQERGYHRIFFTFLRRNHLWSYKAT